MKRIALFAAATCLFALWQFPSIAKADCGCARPAQRLPDAEPQPVPAPDPGQGDIVEARRHRLLDALRNRHHRPVAAVVEAVQNRPRLFGRRCR